MHISDAVIERQFKQVKAEGWLPYFKDAGYGIPTEILLGIASRETNCQQMLGDRDEHGHYHGHGIMQIDDRSFPIFCQHNWRDAEANIKFGAMVLRIKFNEAKSKGVPEADLMRTAIAAYNGGFRAVSLERRGLNVDGATTGHDYSADVLHRASVFKRLLDNDHTN